MAQAGGVVAIFIARRDHHQAKPDHVGQAVSNTIGRARILDAGRKPISNTKALLNFTQQHQTAI